MAPLEPFTFERRDPRADDVVIDIAYCGVCHSDIHQVRDEWFGGIYPMVPGHEIVGRVVAVGPEVKNFKVGDRAGVGCMVDSCGVCLSCKGGDEQYCDNAAAVFTYNSKDKQGEPTYGGYSQRIVVKESFALHIPKNLDLAASAPLLCAGITLYSPLRHWGAGPGKKVGIVGLGGLGHMGVKLAHAMGAHVVLFTTSPGKVEDGKKLGADEVVISKNKDQVKKHERSFDLIIDTVSGAHDLDAELALLKRDASLVLVGIPDKPAAVGGFSLVGRRARLSGSSIGGIRETQEMLDFCGEHNITSDIEMIPIQKINEAYDRVLKSDVKYRFVIDIASLEK